MLENISQGAPLLRSDASAFSLNLWYLPALLFIIAGIIGNILVCLAICMEKRLQNVTNYLLLSLALADLLVCCVVMPFGLVAGILDEWRLGSAWCNFYSTCDVLACTASIWHMSFISLGRYLGIRDPVKNRPRHTRRQVMTRLTLVWIISFGVSGIVTVLGVLDIHNLMPEPHVCAINNRVFLVAGSLLAFFIPMLIMVITFSLTTVLLKKKSGDLTLALAKNTPVNQRCRSTRHSSSTADDQHDQGHASRSQSLRTGGLKTSRRRSPRVSILLSLLPQTEGQPLNRQHAEESACTRHSASSSISSEQKATKVLGLVFTVFVVCWAPFFTLNLAHGISSAISVNRHFEAVFLWLGYVSSTINPIIYTTVNKTFREVFIKLLRCRYSELKRSHSTRNTLYSIGMTMVATAALAQGSAANPTRENFASNTDTTNRHLTQNSQAK